MTTTVIDKLPNGGFVRYLTREKTKEKTKCVLYQKDGSVDKKKMKKIVEGDGAW